MHFSKFAVLASAGLASAATSICDKYTTALLKQNTAANQYTLLKLLVNTALIGNFTGPGTAQSSLPGSMVAVQGILSSTGPLLKYFDGSLNDVNNGGPPTVQSFLDGGGAAPILADPTSAGTPGTNQYMLITHLWQFFGALLGCSMMGTADFPAYGGQASMYNVHKYMDIGESDMTYFITQVGTAALSFGASSADVTTVGMALNSTFGMRCAAPAAVIPAQGAQLQAICIDSTCPEATSPVCASYGAVVTPTPVSSMAASSAAVYSTTPVASQISDGQVQATTAVTPVATQISDGQVQATTPVSAYTGAAAMPTMAAQVVAAAGALAAALL